MTKQNTFSTEQEAFDITLRMECEAYQRALNYESQCTAYGDPVNARFWGDIARQHQAAIWELKGP